MLKLFLNGAAGRMGRAIQRLAQTQDAHILVSQEVHEPLSDRLRECDVAIDFSAREATLPLLRLAARFEVPVVVGTTGHKPDELEELRKLSTRLAIVHAGNFSVGVTVLRHLVQQAAQLLGPGYEAEVMEVHHKHKQDAPSGTAVELVQLLQAASGVADEDVRHGRSGEVGERGEAEIGVHALRGGEVIGEHTVFFFGDQDRIELAHRSASRDIFAAGALRAARWVFDQKPGLYRMEDVLGLGTSPNAAARS